jgi:hypothetical protein
MKTSILEQLYIIPTLVVKTRPALLTLKSLGFTQSIYLYASYVLKTKRFFSQTALNSWYL